MVKQEYLIVSWSGGKDSTATLILAHEKGIKIDEAIISLPWFDKKRKIYADRPEHIKWLFDYAIPLIESWGIKVTVLSYDKDYMDNFYHILSKSTISSRIGKYAGWLISGHCRMNTYKVAPIKYYIKKLKNTYDIVEFVGIGAEELERLDRMDKRNQRSLLAENNITCAFAKELCLKYGLLSPNYTIVNGYNIRGCWFCPNANIYQYANLAKVQPQLWQELLLLNRHKDMLVSEKFNYNFTFDTIVEQVNLINNQLQFDI